MNKLSKTFEKIKLKATPGSLTEIGNICKKLQAIIDRRITNEAKNKIPSYKEELNFFRLFIPDLDLRMSYHNDLDDNLKMLILQPIINKWIKVNFTKCGKIVTVFNKEFPLTTEQPQPAGYSSYQKKKMSKKKTIKHSVISPLKRSSSSEKNLKKKL